MLSPLDKLVGLGCGPLGPNVDFLREGLDASPAEVQLAGLLSKLNGWYAFESALHVFPAGGAEHLDLWQWNSPGLWRDAYGSMADDYVFFAEDVFGGQFGLAEGSVFAFDPETGNADWLAQDVSEWAQMLLEDFEFLTGYPLGHEWQEQCGPLPAGKRLIPKKPFWLGGEYGLENLCAGDAVEGMRLRGDVAAQLLDQPDGTTVRYRIK